MPSKPPSQLGNSYGVCQLHERRECAKTTYGAHEFTFAAHGDGDSAVPSTFAKTLVLDRPQSISRVCSGQLDKGVGQRLAFRIE